MELTQMSGFTMCWLVVLWLCSLIYKIVDWGTRLRFGFFFFLYLFMLAVLSCLCCVQAFPSCREQGLLSWVNPKQRLGFAFRWHLLLQSVVSRAQVHGCGAQA